MMTIGVMLRERLRICWMGWFRGFNELSERLQQFQTPNLLALKALHRKDFAILDYLSDGMR